MNIARLTLTLQRIDNDELTYASADGEFTFKIRLSFPITGAIPAHMRVEVTWKEED